VAHVAESWKRTTPALEVNAFGTSLLLDAILRVVPECVVVITGSALVYRPSSEPLREEDAVGPTDPYGVSKLAQELAALRSGARVVVTRSFNHVGPRQPPSFVMPSFARQIAEIEAGRREPVLLVGNLDARRDITDVRDTVRAYELLAASGQPSRVYNVCSGVAHRVGDLLERLLAMARLRVRVEQDARRMRPSDNPLVVGDRSRIAKDTGWQPEIPIERTLADLLDWWREEVAAESGIAR
jgi:GDP-4-dehydro-6-deoxy-D-mannose reductase